MEVKEQAADERPRGWLTGAAVFGLFAALMPEIAACPLGWAAALLGMLPAILLPRFEHRGIWGQGLNLARCLWSLAVMALTLGLCAQGLVEYNYNGWWTWCPAVLLLALGWRGSYLMERALERLGKLLVWLLCLMAAVLFALTLPRVEPRWLMPRSGTDWLEMGRIFLLSAGTAAALIPARGRSPGVSAVCISSGAAAVTTAAEGPALASMLAYPFLTLCDAAVFEIRISSFGSAMWALSETALLTVLLSRFPGRKWVRLGAAVVVFGLSQTLPWGKGAQYTIIIVGALLGYLPVLWEMVHRRMNRDPHI